MNFELLLLSKVLAENCMSDLSDLHVQDEMFHELKREWKFVRESYAKHGALPSVEAIRDKFPRFEVVDTSDSLSYIVDGFKNAHVRALVLEAMRVQAEALKKKDPIAAVDAMRSVIVASEEAFRSEGDVNVAHDPEARLQDYHDTVKAEGMMGLPSPWEPLDKITQGFQDEELIMIAARGGVGKTWCEVVVAEHHRRLGYPGLLFSKEMSVKQIMRRFDAVSAKVPYGRLKAGMLTTEEYQRYSEALKDMKDTTPLWISGDIDAKMGVTSVAAKIDKYQPRMVYIDGVYMMRDERNAKASWEKFSNICEDLKWLAQRKKVPILVSHQFNLSGKDDAGDADTLKYGDVQMWFDLILGMYQSEALKANKEMLFKVNKCREGAVTQWVSAWDLDMMAFEVRASGVDDLGEYVPKPYVEDDIVPF